MTGARAQEVVGPNMRKLLVVVLVLFAILVVDSVYLGAITFMQWLRDVNLEDVIYQSVFLVHLALGLAIIIPSLVFAGLHLKRAIELPNRLAVRLGISLFVTLLILLASGIALTRGIPLLEVNDQQIRSLSYWLHVISPLAVCWLFILHRLAGPPLRWSVGITIGVVSVAISLGGLWLSEPSDEGRVVAEESYFFPALSRTSTQYFIAAEDLMRDDYCAGCHADTYGQWEHSAHRFASFNNPAYLFSVRNTRRVALERDGDVQAARFCAGCHDPVPLFSGAFDDPEFDDENHPTAQAGITCVACHGIERINSLRGNGDYVIAAPEHYPFAFSRSPFLRRVNELLIKANPDFHKRTFLKPLHKTAEFCGTCHKVHLPVELNHYKFLRGQNHYDSFLLSGVSGHGVSSFYYPPKAITNCSECHMPLIPSSDLAAHVNDESGVTTVHSHQFPGANTALAALLGFPKEASQVHREMLEGSLRLDIFALREGEEIDGEVIAPLRPGVPTLTSGTSYIIDVVVRTLTLGHLFTEGTADSNEVWLDVEVSSGSKILGRSGARHAADGQVDPWSHFINAYVLDRDGNRIDRRNAEDIFTKLYDHQIPPGAADVVHYQLRVPEGVSDPVEFTVSLRYRKFDTRYMRYFQGEDFVENDLPIVTIATDTIVFPVATRAQGDSQPTASALASTPALATAPALALVSAPAPEIPEWQRWNDYGIGLLRKPGARALRPAEAAFRRVSDLGRAEGELNLARVLLREGRLDEAATALRGAAKGDAYPWSVAWFGGLVDLQNAELDSAIEAFTSLIETRFVEARRRGFDFSKDYRLRNQLALTLFERAKLADSPTAQEEWLAASMEHFMAALALDPENLTAHYGLAQVYARLGDTDNAGRHRQLHETYRPDDNAKDRAVQFARRRDPAANHASEAVVIYDLQRSGTYGLDPQNND